MLLKALLAAGWCNQVAGWLVGYLWGEGEVDRWAVGANITSQQPATGVSRYRAKICVCAWPVLPRGVFSSAHRLTFVDLCAKISEATLLLSIISLYASRLRVICVTGPARGALGPVCFFCTLLWGFGQCRRRLDKPTRVSSLALRAFGQNCSLAVGAGHSTHCICHFPVAGCLFERVSYSGTHCSVYLRRHLCVWTVL